MRKLLASATMIAVAGITGAGITQEEPVVLTGTIGVGNPVLGVTEVGGACDPSSPLQGLDGMWFPIAGHDGWSATLDLPAAESDADVYFYDAECGSIDYDDMAQNFMALGIDPFLDNTEQGTVPAGAAFAVVIGYAGVNISFTLTIEPAA